MKRVLCWIGGIVLVLAAVLAIVISQLDTEFISGQISAAVEKATGTPVRFASPPELSLLPPGAKFTAVSWDGVQDGQGMRFTAKGGEAHLELEPLLHGELVIGEVRLDSPSLSLLLPEGKAAAPADAASGNAAGNKPGSEVLLPLELGRLTLSKGSLHVEKGSERYDLRDINLSVENLRNGQDAVLRCDFTYDLLTAGRTLAGTLALDAQAGLFGMAPRVQNLSLTITPSRRGLLPAGLGPVQLQGDASLDTAARQLHLSRLSLSVPHGRVGLTGTLGLDGPAFTGSVLLEGALRKLASALGVQLKPHAQDALLFKGSVTWEGDTLALSQCKGKLDATPLRAELRLHFRDVLAMEGSLSLGKLQLDEYLPLPESGKDAGTAKGKEGKAVAAADKESATSWPTINMRLAMSSLGWKKMHLRDISLALSGSKGDYRLTSFQGVLESGGRLSAGVTDTMRREIRPVRRRPCRPPEPQICAGSGCGRSGPGPPAGIPGKAPLRGRSGGPQGLLHHERHRRRRHDGRPFRFGRPAAAQHAYPGPDLPAAFGARPQGRCFRYLRAGACALRAAQGRSRPGAHDGHLAQAPGQGPGPRQPAAPAPQGHGHHHHAGPEHPRELRRAFRQPFVLAGFQVRAGRGQGPRQQSAGRRQDGRQRGR